MMKPRPASALAFAASIAIAGAIAWVALDTLRDTTAEVIHGETLSEIADKTRALHILAASTDGASAPSNLTQARRLLRSLNARLHGIEPREPRERALFLRLRASYRDIEPLIDEWFVPHAGSRRIERDRQEFLAAQIAMKAQFLADDTMRLRKISQARLLAVQQGAVTTIVSLIVLLALGNAVIYGLALRRAGRAQRALLENQRELSRTQAIARVGSWRLDLQRNRLGWSDESYRIAGIPIGTPLTYESFLAIVHPDDRESVDRRWKAALHGRAPFDIEYRFLVAGETRWAHAQAELGRDADGSVIGASGALHDITERKLAELALRDARADTQVLHRLTLAMAESGHAEELYERLMDAAVEIMRSDFASLQELHPGRGVAGGKGELKLLAHRGFPADAVAHWEWVRADSPCPGGIALGTQQRCDVSDVSSDPRVSGQDREILLATGMRAVQTTPLIARDGRMLGALSTHWKEPRAPEQVSERDFRMLDVLARHATDLLERMQTERALQESEQRIREIFQQLPAGVGVMDRTGRWLLTNPLMDQYVPTAIPSTLPERMPRWSAWDAEGKSVPPEHWPGQRALRGELVLPGLEMLYRAEDGQDVWMRVSAAPLHDADGEIVGATCVVQNIDAVKRTEQARAASEERFRTLVGIITDVPWVTDPSGAFVEPQPAWEAYTGQRWEQARGFGWAKALHAEDRERVKEIWLDACRAHTPYASEARLWHAASGAYRHFVARATPLRNADGSVREWVGTCTDVHEQKQAEQALVEADRRKDDFLAMLAHELRNPLAPIRNAAQLFRLKAPGTPELAWARDVIERQMQHMTRLIDDLMDVSRISRGKLELKRDRFDLADVIRAAVEASRPLIEECRHELTVSLPAQPLILDADFTRLSQVFGNLLNNAAKYTDRGGRIRLTADRHDDGVVVSVEDSGIGLPPEKLASVFELFWQAHGASERAHGGLGIGLSLAKRILELHGGAIEARSAGVGKGSVFVCRLPLVREPPRAAPAVEARNEIATTPRRILIVDDNRDAADSLAIMLQLMGHAVHTAYDGEQAIAVAEELRPEVVLLDLGLPKLDGYEACRTIRQHAWGESMLLIAVTGWGQTEDKRKTKAAGFDHHLLKPVALRGLLQLLGSEPEPAGDTPAHNQRRTRFL